ncbi:MAG: type II toxin-antitoxin system VapC family toxin [Deltaproteobacteria bacterium]|nr:type II toxin-antitoxin system VapC family toxin [Deltaproteobacteria bacterium]
MKVCLDTNAYVAFKRNHTSLTKFLEQADEIYLSSIVLGELYAGFLMGNKTQQNYEELAQFLTLPGIYNLPIDPSIAEHYGHIVQTLRKQGTPIPTNDVWIAASAFEVGARLVTYDDHFKKVPGLTVYSP